MSATENIETKLAEALSAALPAIKTAETGGYDGNLYQQAMDALTEFNTTPQLPGSAGTAKDLYSALQAYVLTVDYGKSKVNPEEWESHLDWATLERNAKAAMEKHNAREERWEMRVVVISTAHLREATCNTFLANLAGDDNDVIELLDGYIVRAGDHIDHIDDIPENYPEELQEALVWAMNRGYTHVRFDSDGDVVSGLTDFDW